MVSTLAKLLTIAALLVLPVAPAGASTSGAFLDDDGNVHEPAIEALAARAVVTGCAPSLYCPALPVRRDHAAALLARVLELGPSPRDFFTDDGGNVHEPDINRLAAAGVAFGDNGRYRPLEPVTREQFASLVVRAFDLPAASDSPFTDTVGRVHHGAVAAAAAARLTVGCAPTLYCPTEHVRRDQAASLIARAIGVDAPSVSPPSGGGGGGGGAGMTIHVYSGGSIPDALAAAPSGGIVEVHTGQYPFFQLDGRSWPAEVTVRAAAGDVGRVGIDGIKLVGVHNFVLANLSLGHVGVHGGGDVSIVDSPALTAVTVRNGAQDVEVTGNRINGGYNGVTVHSFQGEPVPTRIRIAGNEIWGQENDNIQLGVADDVIIEDNLLHDLQTNANHNDGVQTIGGHGLVIRRNRFWNQDQAIMLNATPNLVPGNDVTGVRVENNLVHHERNAGIVVALASDVEVVNNTVADTRHAGLHVEPGARRLRAWNNVLNFLWLMDGTEPLEMEDYNCLGWSGTGVHDRRGNPAFVDTVEYRLGATSPCLDMGTATGAPAEDLAGTPRGLVPDTGAWEHP